MTIDLVTVGHIAQDAARREVLTSMDAQQRFNPAWEIAEVAIHYAIRNGLIAQFRSLPEPRPRVAVEYGAVTNIDFSLGHKAHAVDLAVLYPLVVAAEPYPSSGYAWADINAAALGLIEVKTDWTLGRVVADAKWLGMVSAASAKPDMPELEWVMLVVFFAGSTCETVNRLGEATRDAIAQWGFHALTASNPTEAPSHPGSAGVSERWFEIMSYGRHVCKALRPTNEG